MKLKIISKGGPMETKVINAETGELLENVIYVGWKSDVDSMLSTCHLIIIDPDVDVIVENPQVYQAPTTIRGELEHGNDT